MNTFGDSRTIGGARRLLFWRRHMPLRPRFESLSVLGKDLTNFIAQ
ncbi:unnamed protein product, partial [Brassica rapa subsp. trilocularis]